MCDTRGELVFTRGESVLLGKIGDGRFWSRKRMIMMGAERSGVVMSQLALCCDTALSLGHTDETSYFRANPIGIKSSVGGSLLSLSAGRQTWII